jgi:hypothetical protein
VDVYGGNVACHANVVTSRGAIAAKHVDEPLADAGYAVTTAHIGPNSRSRLWPGIMGRPSTAST